MITLISNVKLFDGSGSPAFQADVVIEDELIKAVAKHGEFVSNGADEIIDGSTLALAPGFIDAHSHSDLTIIRYPESESRITQGITSEIDGNCGDGEFWCGNPEVREQLTAKNGSAPEWEDLAGFVRAVDRRKSAVNYAILAGHGSLRENVMGRENRPPGAAEMHRMKELLQSAFDQGAAGFSTGLVYVPGMYAKTSEILELAKLIPEGGIYATHLRSEESEVEAALREAVYIARSCRRTLQVSHLKTLGQRNWARLNDLLEVIDMAQRAGLDVHADRYPYVFAASSLRSMLPEPFHREPDVRNFLHEAAHREELLVCLNESRNLTVPWDKIIYSASNFRIAAHRKWCGLTLDEIGRNNRRSAAEIMVELLSTEDAPQCQFGGMSEDNLKEIYRQPYVMMGSDSSGVPLDKSGPRTHPRAFGSAPRFFRQVSALVSPEEAVRRMTSLPAQVFHLAGRGLVKENHFADLTLFDEDKFDVPEDYAEPRRPAAGVRRVWVNGVTAFDVTEDKKRERAGKFLPGAGAKLN